MTKPQTKSGMPVKFLRTTETHCPIISPRSLEYAAVNALAPTNANPSHNGTRNDIQRFLPLPSALYIPANIAPVT